MLTTQILITLSSLFPVAVLLVDAWLRVARSGEKPHLGVVLGTVFGLMGALWSVAVLGAVACCA